MRNILFFSIICLFTSCSNYKGFNVSQEGRNCLKKEDLDKLIASENFSDDKPSDFYIFPIITGKHNCIGLFGFGFKNPTVTWRVVLKALKFDDSVYVFNKDDQPSNMAALQEFKMKYNRFFTEKELEELSTNFLKGRESNARYY
jgi:hypothetical protein